VTIMSGEWPMYCQWLFIQSAIQMESRTGPRKIWSGFAPRSFSFIAVHDEEISV
jgi:hypothetical protein